MKNMKIVWGVFFIGLLILYFVDAAFKIYEIDLEMLRHNLIGFIVGFVILGGWWLGKHKFQLKICLYAALLILLADDIYDYINNIDDLTFPMIFHDIFIVFWGAVVGWLFYRHDKKRISP